MGLLLGCVALFAFYTAHGVWLNFVMQFYFESTNRLGYINKDPSLALLFLACIILMVAEIRNRSFRFFFPMGFAIAAGVMIPAGLLATRKFPIYYSWMVYIPVALALAGEISRRRATVSSAAQAMVALSLCGACLVGLPVQMASAAYYWKDRNIAANRPGCTQGRHPPGLGLLRLF